MERVQEFGPVMAQLKASLKKDGFPYPLIVTEKRCIDIFLDGICEIFFRRCNYNDCRLTNDTAQHCGYRDTVYRWHKCAVEKCEQEDECVPQKHLSDIQNYKLLQSIGGLVVILLKEETEKAQNIGK